MSLETGLLIAVVVGQAATIFFLWKVARTAKQKRAIIVNGKEQ